MSTITVFGHLTKKPIAYYKESGEILKVTFTVAENTKRKEKEFLDFYPCVSFGKYAEIIFKYADRISFVIVEGVPTNRIYKEKLKFSILISKIKIVGWKNEPVQGAEKDLIAELEEDNPFINESEMEYDEELLKYYMEGADRDEN